MSTLAVGLVSTSTLFGSAIATIVVGMIGNRYSRRSLLLIAAAMMAATGIGFFSFSTRWPLLVVAFVGTMNPSAGDVSLFLPIEHACLAEASQAQARTALFARYSLVGALSSALGALLTGVPDLIAGHFEVLALSAQLQPRFAPR
jgi:MFS family permease